VALVHSTNLQPEGGDLFTVPVALIPSQGEDQEVMNAIWERLHKKSFASKCVRKDFVSERKGGVDCSPTNRITDHHGFASARSNWNDEHLSRRARAREAYAVMAQFFAANLS